MNEHLLRVYTRAAAPADRAASQRALQQHEAAAPQKQLVHSRRGAHTVNVRPEELKQLLSEDEKQALSAMFASGNTPRNYGHPAEMLRVSGNLVDRVV